jgi:hypothetical protein
MRPLRDDDRLVEHVDLLPLERGQLASRTPGSATIPGNGFVKVVARSMARWEYLSLRSATIASIISMLGFVRSGVTQFPAPFSMEKSKGMTQSGTMGVRGIHRHVGRVGTKLTHAPSTLRTYASAASGTAKSAPGGARKGRLPFLHVSES